MWGIQGTKHQFSFTIYQHPILFPLILSVRGFKTEKITKSDILEQGSQGASVKTCTQSLMPLYIHREKHLSEKSATWKLISKLKKEENVIDSWQRFGYLMQGPHLNTLFLLQG